MVTKAPAPQAEIGYAANATGYSWWAYEGETTPELQWPQSVEVYDAMRRTDSQVASVLRAVTLPVRRTPWRIDPAGARAEVVEFVADDLGLPIVGQSPKVMPRTKDRFSWPEHLRLALLMLSFGFSYFEQTYRVDPDGSRAHLHKLGPRPARTIANVDVARDGGLVSITQWGQIGDQQGPQAPIPVGRIVAYVCEREGGNWLGQSLLRTCYKNWLIKDRLLRVQAQTIERNGMGVPLYKGQEDASDADLATGLGLATSWRAGEAAGTAIPFGADLVLRGVEGTLPDALPAIEYHDSQIARAVLAHFLNLGTQTGSWALGTTFADFFTLSLQTLAQQIADTATQHIIEDLVDINFGENEPAPRLTFDEIGSRQAATAQALKSLADAGFVHPDEVLEESTRQTFGLPPRDEETTFAPPPDVSGDGGPQVPEPTSDRPGSVAAAGDAGPKGSAATAALDLAEDDDFTDGEAVEALILALAEYSGQVAAAEFNESLHPRSSNGRFRSLADRILDAITHHHEHGGKGHADPFEGFDREQLRKAAKARGIDLKRGESRDSIAEKLLADVGPGRKSAPKADADKPKAPPRKRAPRKAAPKKADVGEQPKPKVSAPHSDLTGRYQLPDGVTQADANALKAALKRRENVSGMPGGDDLALVERLSNESNRDYMLGNFQDINPALGRLTKAQAKVELARRTKEAFAGRQVATNLNIDSLLEILKEGRFKTQFETGRSGGIFQPEERMRREREWFGLPDDTDPAQRPIYGYLVSRGGGKKMVDFYGDAQVIFKPQVRTRTTATVGDSMENILASRPSPVDDPEWHSFTVNSDRDVLDRLERNYDGPAFNRKTYLEAQVHGGVSLDDIAELVLPERPDPRLLEWLKKRGIPWRVRARS